MTVQTFNPTDLSQSAANWAVAQRIVGPFAPHAQVVPNLTLALDPGYLLNGTTLTEVNAQNVGPFAPPASGFRIDRVVIDRSTGAASIVTGAANSLTPPALPAGKLPVARVLLQPTTGAIVNELIVDERALTNQTPAPVNQVIFRAFLGTDQVIAPSGGWTKIDIANVDFDIGSSFDATNKQFKPSVPGYYQVSASVGYASVPSGNIITCNIFKNGIRSSTGNAHAASTGSTASGLADIVYLNGTTDYLDVRTLQTAAQSLTVYGLSLATWFSANRIG